MNCKYCGKILVKTGTRGPEKTYCNGYCRDEYRKKQSRSRTAAQKWPDCLFCGSRITGHKRRYCDKQCRERNRFKH